MPPSALHPPNERRAIVAAMWLGALGCLSGAGCGPGPDPAGSRGRASASLRLVERMPAARIEGEARVAEPRRPEEWAFRILPPGGPAWSTGGVHAGPGIAELRVEDGLLKGRVDEPAAVLWCQRATRDESDDAMHSIELRMRCDAGSNAYFSVQGPGEPDLEHPRASWRDEVAYLRVPLQPDGELRAYVFEPRRVWASRSVSTLMICPSDTPGTEFEIESIRFVTRSAHAAELGTAVAWQEIEGLGMESIVTRAGERVGFELDLPRASWLDLHVAALAQAPQGFRVEVQHGRERELVGERQVSGSGSWEAFPVELEKWSGSRVTLWLALESPHPGAVGVWGAPVVRARLDPPGPQGADASAAPDGDPQARSDAPRGVILVLGDTLRLDRLSFAGHDRETSPALDVLARRGALFEDCSVPATWTQPSAVSLVTSLYPSSHDVIRAGDTIPESATTLAEAFREAGFATLAHSAVRYTGRFTRFDQGFDLVYEAAVAPSRYPSKTAAQSVPRVLSWLEQHRRDRFFVFLHVYDPHYPYEPRPPFDSRWTDSGQAADYQLQTERARAAITDDGMREVGLPSAQEFAAAGVDARAWLEHTLGWYDGSILGMDQEIARLMQGLRSLGLLDETLVVFTSDHGEEFLEHGRTWHGQGVYGELIRAPLIFFGARIPRSGVRIDEPVSTIDVMPTLLEMFDLPAPRPMQGRSLLPLIERAAGQPSAEPWPERVIVAEKPSLPDSYATVPPRRAGMVALLFGDWKLIHNDPREDERPEWELFDRRRDPLDLHDVAEQNPQVVERLRQRLEAWRAEVARVRLERGQQAELDAATLSNLREMGYAK